MTTTPDSITLDEILVTDDLARRPDANYDAQANAAYLKLATESVTNPQGLLQTLCDLALELCDAGTSGISILRTNGRGEQEFVWEAMSGELSQYVGGTTPRDFSPCGTTLDCGATQLFSNPGRLFTYFNAVTPSIVEGLVVPFAAPESEAIGTLWVVTHDDQQFSRGHVKVMEGLAKFTASAYELLRTRKRAEAGEQSSQARADRAEAAASKLEARADKLLMSNMLKDEFASLVAHELRSPLTTILGYARLLKSRPNLGAETVQEAATDMAREGARLQRMLENFLVMARPELNPKPFEPMLLNRQIQTIVKDFRHNSSQPIELDEAGAEDLIVLAEPSFLTQIMENLLTNAVKYAGSEQSMHVTISTAGGKAQVSVRDHGEGVPEADLHAVFNSFYRGKGTSVHTSGVGLGLVVCKRLIGALGGDIWVQNAPDGGAIFTFDLPLAE